MKLVCFLLFITLSFTAFSQRYIVPNLQGFDEQRKYHFGFYLGTNDFNTSLKLNQSIFTNDTIYSANVNGKIGFDLGIVTDLHLGKFFDFRSLFPTLSFGQRDFEYRIRTNTSEIFTDIRTVESTYLSAPFEFKYKSKRYGNFRAFLMAGWTSGFDLVSQKDVDQNDKSIVRLKRWTHNYDYGFGFEFFFEFFKFAPQVKWSNGVNNLLIKDKTPFTDVIDAVRAKTVHISLTFEG